MQRFESCGVKGVLRIDRKGTDGELLHLLGNKPIGRFRHFDLAKLILNGDFPAGGCAEVKLVSGIGKNSPRFLADCGIVGQHP